MSVCVVKVYATDVETIIQLLFTDADFFRGFLKARNTISESQFHMLCTLLRRANKTMYTALHFPPSLSTTLSFLSDIDIGEWQEQTDGSKLRDLNYTVALNYSFGPKFSPTTEHQVYSNTAQPGLKHLVHTEVSHTCAFAGLIIITQVPDHSCYTLLMMANQLCIGFHHSWQHTISCFVYSTYMYSHVQNVYTCSCSHNHLHNI